MLSIASDNPELITISSLALDDYLGALALGGIELAVSRLDWRASRFDLNVLLVRGSFFLLEVAGFFAVKDFELTMSAESVIFAPIA